MFTKILSLLTGLFAALTSPWATPGTEIGIEIGAAGPRPLRLILATDRIPAYTAALAALDELQAAYGPKAELIVRIGAIQRVGKARTVMIPAPILEAAGPAAKLRTRIKGNRTRAFRRTLRG